MRCRCASSATSTRRTGWTPSAGATSSSNPTAPQRPGPTDGWLGGMHDRGCVGTHDPAAPSSGRVGPPSLLKRSSSLGSTIICHTAELQPTRVGHMRVTSVELFARVMNSGSMRLLQYLLKRDRKHHGSGRYSPVQLAEKLYTAPTRSADGRKLHVVMILMIAGYIPK